MHTKLQKNERQLKTIFKFTNKNLKITLKRNLSEIKDYSKFLNKVALRRSPSPIRELMPLTRIPGMISLGGGLPNPTLFPFKNFNFTLETRQSISIEGQLLDDALQYTATYGLPELLEVLKEHQIAEHSPQISSNKWSILVTTGSQDGFAKAFETLIDEDDVVLLESPTYTGAISVLKPIGCKLEAIESDGNGIIPSKLEERLLNWPYDKKPKILYLIPTGQNPSGSTLSIERRTQVYDIACRFDLLILEDDPYWNLQFRDSNNPPLKSLFSIDTEGRVIRFDSFSKVLSAGIRMGWITGPKALVENMQLQQQATQLHTSGLTQAVILSLLKHWGRSGWENHIEQVQKFYKMKRDELLGAANEHLTGLAEWDIPTAGMFCWFKLIGIEDSQKLVTEKAVNKKVLLLPGCHFMINNKLSNHVRASYSIASKEQLNEALKRFADLLKQELSK
eukprot:TRINITY_DN1902_c0_g1_i1.p1 TRINITY_DN1902_c0_g1~~TRINITY_DN1902_c0_g1_i1.p1  ORF type:complete len:450 (-),score=189.85 TRINITY_DN1902_c0_g1_i1:54-1403(-)